MALTYLLRPVVFGAAVSTALGLSTPAHGQTPDSRVFSEIDVQGNRRFSDEDVLATSGLQAGVPLGQIELERAYEALQFTGEFDSVEIRSVGNTLIILVDETPQYSGGLTFGLGYDTDTGVFGAVGLLLRDTFGPESTIAGNLLIAEEVQTLSFDAASPNFWGESNRGGVRLSFGNYEYDDVTYRYQFARVEPYVQYDVGENSQVELRYTLEQKRVFDIEATASPILQAEAGRDVSSGIGFTFATGSSRDAAEPVNSGSWFLRFDQDFTGLGGDTELSLTELSFGGRRPLGGNGFALRTRIDLGAVVGHGSDDPRVSERFTLGGSRLRGFDRGGISPRDICAGCGAGGTDVVTDLGGNYYAVARTDLLVPLFANRPEIETFVFFDVGSVWNVDTDTAASGILDDGKTWRNSAGIGTSFDTQLGQFEAYLALHTDGNSRDDVQEFGLTFRSEF